MKQILFVVSALLLFAACNSDKKPAETTGKDVTVKSITTPEDERTQKMEELKKLSPLTLEQMRVLLPTELDSVKERNFLASTQFGYGIASVEYPKAKSAGLKVTLYDCAGELGAPIYFENYWNNLNVMNDTEKEYTKTIDFMGGKAIENYKKDLNLSTLTFSHRGRLIIMVEGRNIKPDQLREKAQKLYSKIS